MRYHLLFLLVVLMLMAWGSQASVKCLPDLLPRCP